MTDYKKVGNNIKRGTALILGAVLLCLALCSCAVDLNIAVDGEKLDFLSMSKEELDVYLEIGEYTGLQISLAGKTKEATVWDALVEKITMKEYPEKHVYYYIDQLKAQYRYYAEQAGVSYEDILKELGQSEGGILKYAQTMTKKDVLYAIIVKKEGISVSESEKQALFDKYVDSYVQNYGYNVDYVKQNMADLIYDSMLYDKTTEFLILNNTFQD